MDGNPQNTTVLWHMRRHQKDDQLKWIKWIRMPNIYSQTFCLQCAKMHFQRDKKFVILFNKCGTLIQLIAKSLLQPSKQAQLLKSPHRMLYNVLNGKIP
jgi:hypothetical protein